jgi:hypothetical protein
MIQPKTGFDMGEIVTLQVGAKETRHLNVRAKLLLNNGDWEHQLWTADARLYEDGKWFGGDVLRALNDA